MPGVLHGLRSWHLKSLGHTVCVPEPSADARHRGRCNGLAMSHFAKQPLQFSPIGDETSQLVALSSGSPRVRDRHSDRLETAQKFAHLRTVAGGALSPKAHPTTAPTDAVRSHAGEPIAVDRLSPRGSCQGLSRKSSSLKTTRTPSYSS
jgi:hypothetical protein